MKERRPAFLYGPIHSRRLGRSLGVSPIPRLTCNMSCIYCQLGRIRHMRNNQAAFYPVPDILEEFKDALASGVAFDAVSIVGDGEPTLYSSLGVLIDRLKALTDKPVVLITNGALLSEKPVRDMARRADIVMPSLDAVDETMFKTINRPHPSIHFDAYLDGLRRFSEAFEGEIHMEIMLLRGENDDEATLRKFKEILNTIRHEKLYLNVPVRPPAESSVKAPDDATIRKAEGILGGIALNLLFKEGYQSSIEDPYEALKSIIERHPLNRFEIESFLHSRNISDTKSLLRKLGDDPEIEIIPYKGYETYRSLAQ